MRRGAVHGNGYSASLSRNYVRPSQVLSQTVAVFVSVHVAESQNRINYLCENVTVSRTKMSLLAQFSRYRVELEFSDRYWVFMADRGNSVYLAITAMLLSAPATACAHKEPALDCHVEGIKYLNTDLDDRTVCARFVAGLGDAKARVTFVHIVVTQRGSITVELAMANGDALDMGMDIMDRPIRISDIDQLAQSVAGQL
jgi:hypothetical protein